MKDKIWYEVWAVGASDDCWDIEEYLGEYYTPEEAIEFAKQFTDIPHVYADDPENPSIISKFSPDAHMIIQVETVTEPFFGVAENIKTIYEKDIFMS